jgi:hypothetical protein
MKIVKGQPLEGHAEGRGFVFEQQDGSTYTFVQGRPLNSVAEVEPAFTKVETPPVFSESGGFLGKWLRDLDHSDKLKGTSRVRFIVERSGRPTSFSIVSEKTTNVDLARWVIESIKSGPDWKPGEQKGKPVASVVEVSFKN